MKKSILAITLIFACSIGVSSAQSDAKKMQASKNITENVSKAATLTALSTGLKGTSMGKKFEAQGNYTFFAINDAGFDKTLHGTTQKMLSDHYLPMLDKILNFHTIEGKFTIQDLKAKVEASKGGIQLKTLNGESIKVNLVNGKIVLSDTKGNTANIIESDVKQGNGIIHIVDAMLLPEAL
jgi:uncharacterized surface protein with fasciclin (FAS1) repeats